MMTLDKNDPRLTAYALSELDGDDRAELEAALAESPDARDEIESIRQLAGNLTEAYAAEPSLGLDRLRKQEVEGRTTNRHGVARNHPIKRYLPMALAASLLIAASAAVIMPSLKKARVRDPEVREYSRRLSEAQSESKPNQVPLHQGRGGNTGRGLTAAEHNQLSGLGYLRGTVKSGADTRSYYNSSSVVSVVDGHATPNNTGLIPRIKNQSTIRGRTRGPYASARQPQLGDIPAARVLFEIWDVDGDGLGDASEWDFFSHSASPNFARIIDVVVTTNGYEIPAFQATDGNTERYQPIFENPFQTVTQYPLSTFSIDVDTASYSNLRRFINGGSLPPPDAIRIEEMINYFDYDYPPPTDGRPFSVSIDVVDCPWNATNLLARIGLKGVEVAAEDRPPSNLVFLIDVSGSMGSANKLTLVKQALALLVGQLDELDRVAIVVYAGASGMALDSTTCDQQRLILDSINELESGGSTNGGAGIELAYDIATRNFIDGGTNRVILCTDGDFNVGVTDQGSLTRLIKDKAKSGVFLSALGFGMGNLNDATLESLADNGNGNYAYIDTWTEARKVLVEQLTGTLVTIAKDVKIQIEFNPAQAASYRLIGYENRLLAAEDFNDDTKDAGEIGAGHTVTALYEIVPAGAATEAAAVDPLKYQAEASMTAQASSDELMTVKLRYKLPDGDTSHLIERTVKDEGLTIDDATDDMRFAAGVASLGMLLRHSDHAGNATFESVLGLVENGIGEDAGGYRTEFIQLARTAANMTPKD